MHPHALECVSGEAFRRVAFKDRNRGGMLTMGAVLTLTSYPLRTSPVLRATRRPCADGDPNG